MSLLLLILLLQAIELVGLHILILVVVDLLPVVFGVCELRRCFRHHAKSRRNASSRVLSYCCSGPVLRRQHALLKSPATISMSSGVIPVRTASNTFNAVLRFLATTLWQCSDMIVKLDLPFLGMCRNRAFDTTASKAYLLQNALSAGTYTDLTSGSGSNVCALKRVAHVKLAGDVFMLEELSRFLKCHDTPWSGNVAFDGSWRAACSTWLQTQDTQACLFR